MSRNITPDMLHKSGFEVVKSLYKEEWLYIGYFEDCIVKIFYIPDNTDRPWLFYVISYKNVMLARVFLSTVENFCYLMKALELKAELKTK